MSHSPYSDLSNPDALSAVLSGLELSAEIYHHRNYCGAWAVDTSGSRRIPFHLIGRGEAWLHIAGHPPRRLSAGDLVIFPRDSQHVIAHAEELPPGALVNAPLEEDEGPVTNMVCGFFEFAHKSAWPLLDSLAPVIVIDLSDMSTFSALRGLIDLIIAELQRRSPGFYTVINHLAYLLFVQVLRLQIEQGKVNAGLLAALFDEQISKALSAIHNHPEQRWTLAQLAKEASMGRSAFASHFNELTGVPPIQYLTAWRMQEASNLLDTTRLSIGRIAERCGYESEAAFRKAFKKTTGSPPGELRRQAHRRLQGSSQSSNNHAG